MTTAGHPGLRRHWSSAAGLLAPAACGLLVLVVPQLDSVHGLVLLFFAGGAASLLLAPRGLSAARTWAVGYLLLQVPVRALFLLTAPKERPPLYAELSPGVGLEPALVKALLQSCAGLGVMLLAYCLVPRPATAPVVGAVIRRSRFFWLLALAAVMLPVEIATASSSAAGGGFILSMPGLAAAGAAAAACYALVVRPRQHILVGIVAIAYSAARVTMLHSKLGLLSCLAAALVGFTAREHERRGRSLTVRGMAVLVAIVVAALTVFAVSSGRSRGQDFAGAVGQGGSAAVSRSYGVDGLIASNSYLDSGGRLMHGSSLVELSTSWVPRQLWPDKPRSFSIRYGEEVFSFSHSVGHEFFAPSYSGEWVLNFGLVGILVGWALFGALLAKVDAIPSIAHRMLWLVPVVHLIEGSIVAQFWLAAPFLVGGYAVLRRVPPQSVSTLSPLRRLRVSKT